MFINERQRNANTYLISNFDSLEAAPSNLPRPKFAPEAKGIREYGAEGLRVTR